MNNTLNVYDHVVIKGWVEGTYAGLRGVVSRVITPVGEARQVALVTFDNAPAEVRQADWFDAGELELVTPPAKESDVVWMVRFDGTQYTLHDEHGQVGEPLPEMRSTATERAAWLATSVVADYAERCGYAGAQADMMRDVANLLRDDAAAGKKTR